MKMERLLALVEKANRSLSGFGGQISRSSIKSASPIVLAAEIGPTMTKNAHGFSEMKQVLLKVAKANWFARFANSSFTPIQRANLTGEHYGFSGPRAANPMFAVKCSPVVGAGFGGSLGGSQ